MRAESADADDRLILHIGSSAHIARRTDTPVLLVLDVWAMARTAAALVAGLRDFDRRVRVAGVILHRVGSPRHAAMVTQAIEGEGIKGEAGRTAAGAGVGAIIGGILGGFKGALAGILIGGGGTIAATEGKDVELPQGSVLRVRIDSPLTIQGTAAAR